MKNIKKFLLITAMTMALGTSAFAASGFEFLLQASGGINVGIPTKETKDLFSEIKGQVGGGAGVDAQIGYMISVKDGFGVSVLAELGYSWDFYRMGYGDTGIIGSSANGVWSYEAKDGLNYWQQYHSFKIGLLPKFNIGVGGKGAIALGIGGGVKIPLVGRSGTVATSVGTRPTKEELESRLEVNLKRQDIVDLYSPSVIGYVKVTFDYYLFFTDNIGMNFGLYLGGDFAPKMKETKIGADAFDIGLQLGFRFGPKA